jgi:hypothetical protein
MIALMNPEQWFVDVFIAQVSFYLVFCELLYQDQLWDILPFNFELPQAKLDGNILNQANMRWFGYIMKSLKILGSPFVREMEWMLTGFFNGFGDNYLAGDLEADRHDFILDLIGQVSGATLTEIDRRTTTNLEFLAKAQRQNLDLATKFDDEIGNLKTAIIEIYHRLNAFATPLRTDLLNIETSLERHESEISSMHALMADMLTPDAVPLVKAKKKPSSNVVVIRELSR